MEFLLSDSDSFSESSSCEDQDDIELMYSGQASSILSSLEETITKIDNFLSFERGFKHGDIVCSVTDPSGQMGTVVNVDIFVDLESIRGKKIIDVSSRKLEKISSTSVGDYVVHGPWLGKVNKIVDCVTVLFDDGLKCDFTVTDPEKILPVSPDLCEDPQYFYYPGQRVKVDFSSNSKSARWLCSSWETKRVEGTVCAVEAGLVYVDWLGCSLFSSERVHPPPCLQKSTCLTLLSCFPHANWQLGDWCLFPRIDHEDITEQIDSNAYMFGCIAGQKKLQKVFGSRENRANFQEIFVIVKTKTKIDVLWQNGIHSVGLDSHSLSPVNVFDSYDFMPELFVLEKGVSDDPLVSHKQRWGFVKSMDAKERTVKVKWKAPRANQESDGEEEWIEETVSAYELVEHPDYSFCIGDAVFRMEKSPLVDQINKKIYSNFMATKRETSEEADLNGMNSHGEQEPRMDTYLSQIGVVIGFKDGRVIVKWATGLSSMVAPYEIFQMDKIESPSSPLLNMENIEQVSEEITEHEPLDQKQKDFLNFTAYSLPRAAVGFVTSIVTRLLRFQDSTLRSDKPDLTCENGYECGATDKEEVLGSQKLCAGVPSTEGSDLQSFEEMHLKQQVSDPQENEPLLSSTICEKAEEFKHFDIVSGCGGHHFVGGFKMGLTLSQMKRSWLKKVQQEWSILKENLPESIYVRVYEERMDLLRAVVVGAPATPYHDGLFFFDIFLPPEYPHEPPLVHYNSGGLRINPNLYESGRVCLSLLNTWTGTSAEVWNPGSSSILQVLLSIQALVLNEKPYFNEAGYDKQIGRAEGEKKSVSYNENAFLESCKSMLYLLRNPPKHFEDFVKEHFSRRSKHILLACKTYMEGAPVGGSVAYGKSEEAQGSSTGFKIMLAKLFPKLLKAFSDKGIDCSQFTEPRN